MSKSLQKVVDHIVDRALNEERLLWHRPWQQSLIGMAKNLKSGNPYNGINIFTLMHETRSAYWVTYRQAQELGGQVRKGSKGSPVVWYSKLEKKELSAQGEKQYFACLKSSTVFCIDDVDGIDRPVDEKPVELQPHEKIDVAEGVIENWHDRPEFKEHYAHAFYKPSDDSISMPLIGQFNSAEEYYSTLFHECIHATGAKHRLERDMSGGMGSNSYSKEELVAELGACLLRAQCQLDAPDVDDNSVAYLQGWSKKLRDKPQMFQYAATRAVAASQYILAGGAE